MAVGRPIPFRHRAKEEAESIPASPSIAAARSWSFGQKERVGRKADLWHISSTTRTGDRLARLSRCQASRPGASLLPWHCRTIVFQSFTKKEKCITPRPDRFPGACPCHRDSAPNSIHLAVTSPSRTLVPVIARIHPSGRQILPGSPKFYQNREPGLAAIYGGAFAAMELTTILNRCHHFRGFVYEHARFSTDKRSIEVVLRPRKGSAAVCSRCHLPAPGYDQLAERRVEFIPWGDSSFSCCTRCRCRGNAAGRGRHSDVLDPDLPQAGRSARSHR